MALKIRGKRGTLDFVEIGGIVWVWLSRLSLL